MLKAGDKLNVVCKQLGLPQFQPQHINFLREYTTLMGPVAKALDVLQGEKNCYFGYVIPTVVTLREKLNASSPALHVTQPLKNALLNGIEKQFSDYMSNPDCIMATITHPKFKLSYLPPALHGAYMLRLDQEVNVMNASVAHAESNQDDDDFLFWTAGEQNGQAGSRDRLAFAGLVLTMYAVIAARSDDNVTTIISCSSRH